MKSMSVAARPRSIFLSACLLPLGAPTFCLLACSSRSDGPAPDISLSTGGQTAAGGTAAGNFAGNSTGLLGDAGNSHGQAGGVQGGEGGASAEPPRNVQWLAAPASRVNTTIGTTSGGNMFPGADYPFGMVQWSPDTAPDRSSGGGYDYKDSSIIGFSLTHISGPGCSGALGDVPILPISGGMPGGDLNAVQRPFSHDGEIATAGYYSVAVGTPRVKTELTATLHSAMARFTYPTGDAGGLLFKLKRSANGNYGDAIAEIVSDHELTGATSSGGFCGTGAPYTVYFDVVFDQPFMNSKILPEAGKTAPGFIFVDFDTARSAVVQAKVGISFVSVANARGNWNAENPSAQWNFDTTKGSAVQAWNELLGKVQISGGTSSAREMFYTALYHSLLHPNVASDSNGQYTGFDNQVHTVGGGQQDQYVNYSGWDIYHSQVQLSALLAPDAMSDSAQSMLNDAAQNGGHLLKWSLEHGENGIMVGDPSDGIIAGYYAFGAKKFDTASALRIMLNEATMPNDIRPGLSYYASLGYVPDDVGWDQAGGMSIEYNQADFALSLFAGALGDTRNQAAMLTRSQSWQNMYDASVGMLIPKLKNGAFVSGVGPSSSHGLTEGDASQYRWVIAYDRAAQLAAMGGAGVANPALGAFFSKLDDYQGPSALMTNEFELGAQFWSNHTGEPWKTQEVAHRIRTQLYHDAPKYIDGVDTNDDLGALSSALAWTMLGVYPEYPGSAILSINGPEFADERIRLPSGKYLTIHADGVTDAASYIQSLSLNGAASQRTWLDAALIDTGAELDFVMGGTPNQNWGTDSADPLFAAGLESTSAFLYAVPNTLSLGPNGSADLILAAQSARSDSGQTLTWEASAPPGFTLSATSGSIALDKGARATSKVNVHASGGTGNYTITFKLKSSLNVAPPSYVLPVTVH